MLSKVDILKNILLRDIHSGVLRNGDTIPSRNQLRQKYGFSLTTINKTVNDLISMGYLSAVKGSVTKVLSTTPVVQPQQIFGISGFNDNDLDPIKNLLFSYNNVSYPFIGIQEHDAVLKLDLITKPGSVIIWVSQNSQSLFLMNHFKQLNIPQIQVNRDFKGYNFVATDTPQSIRNGLSWLMIESGREIALVSSGSSSEKSFINERLVTFYETALDLGATLRSSMIFQQNPRDISGSIAEIGTQLFLSPNRPKGIFILHSPMALPLVSFARAHNLLPGRDYHMLVFDDVRELQNTPGIGMLKQRVELMFNDVNRWLDKVFSLKDSTLQKYISAELVVA